ncbi:unnamed protein product [Spirodela intermedia]|uniref:Glycosyltransferase 61 catalytic domain-containing protein n=1 Tax=Spirodela intermedia TaxID=51605 RepID=A0A7I8LF03_SPIIN|nr:unnamed protein product [Spirodela intermedia]
MSRTAPVEIIGGEAQPPPCDVTHTAPAVVFSTGGYAGNFFHDVSEVLIPLFLTAGQLRHVQLVASDYQYYWVAKYRRVLDHLAGSPEQAGVVAAASPSSPVEPTVHCFPAAVVGLKYHGNLACNATAPPGGVTIHDFRRFLREALSLSPLTPNPPPAEDQRRPLLVLLSRRNSRALLNEAAVAELAREVGFRVEVAGPEALNRLEAFSRVVAGAAVLVGVHGAGMTNMVFLREGAVVLQVVPWGLQWAAMAYFQWPAEAMGLQYMEYKVAVEESTLSEDYPPDHPVLADPWAIDRLGYNVSGPVYTDGQKVRLNLTRFRESLLEALRRLPRPA